MAKKKSFQIGNALTEGLEETITAVHQYAGEMRIDIISLKRIEVDPENPRDLLLTLDDVYYGLNATDKHYVRKLEELESLQSMANSIREQGIINPIVVYKFGEKYRLVAGERRTLASVLAGKSEIQAKILDSKPNPLKISLLQWIENVERSDLSLWERLRNLDKIVMTYAEKKGIPPAEITVTELSHLIGCSKPHAINYKAVLFTDEALKQLIRDNRIKNLEKAALIASHSIPEVKEQLITTCLAGASLKKMRVIMEQADRKLATRHRLSSVKKRGRQATAIHLGMTKNLKVAKVLADAIAQHPTLAFFAHEFLSIDWNDYHAITSTFKQVIKQLEEHYV